MAAGAAELLELVVGPEGDSSFRIEPRASAGGQRGRRGNFFVCRKARGECKRCGRTRTFPATYFFGASLCDSMRIPFSRNECRYFPNKCGPIVSYDEMDTKESCDGFDSGETGLRWAQSHKALGCFCGDDCADGSRNEFGLGASPRFNCFRSGCRD